MTTMPVRRGIAIAVFLVLAVAPAAPAMGQGRSDLALAALARVQHVPNEVLVQFRRGADATEKAAARGRVGAEQEEVIVPEARRQDLKGDLELVRIPPGIGIAAAVRELESDPAVEFAEPNWLYQHAATSNDPYYTGLHRRLAVGHVRRRDAAV